MSGFLISLVLHWKSRTFLFKNKDISKRLQYNPLVPYSTILVQVSREGKGSWEPAEGLHTFWAPFRRRLLQPGLSLCWAGDPSVSDGSLGSPSLVLCGGNPVTLSTFPQKRFSEAKEVYLKGIEKCPKNSDLHNNYGVFLVDTGEVTSPFMIFSLNQRVIFLLLSVIAFMISFRFNVWISFFNILYEQIDWFEESAGQISGLLPPRFDMFAGPRTVPCGIPAVELEELAGSGSKCWLMKHFKQPDSLHGPNNQIPTSSPKFEIKKRSDWYQFTT